MHYLFFFIVDKLCTKHLLQYAIELLDVFVFPALSVRWGLFIFRYSPEKTAVYIYILWGSLLGGNNEG